MLKITAVETSNRAATLRLEGQLVDRWVKELESECTKARASDVSLALDLSGVTFVDEGGLLLLESLADARVSLVNASPFVATLLKGSGL